MSDSLEEDFMAAKLRVGIPLLSEEEAKENLYQHAITLYRLVRCCNLLREENKRLVDFINGVRFLSPYHDDETDGSI